MVHHHCQNAWQNTITSNCLSHYFIVFLQIQVCSTKINLLHSWKNKNIMEYILCFVISDIFILLYVSTCYPPPKKNIIWRALYAVSPERSLSPSQLFDSFLCHKTIMVGMKRNHPSTIFPKRKGMQAAGAYPGSCKPREPCESLILAPWSKVKECHPNPPPGNFGSQKFSSCTSMVPLSCWFTYCIFLCPFFFSSPFFLSLPLSFFFFPPLVTPGVELPKPPSRYALDEGSH